MVQATKKGLLFYGPPGTGKTHTVHYPAKAIPDQTVFLISAEQVKYLSDYMTLARLLQPSLVVIEDVDLIARERSDHNDPTTEVLLNKLLNEMDGLKEDALILFILTTNRPEALEAALAARPGRIDQAIEFPVPDESGREQLVRLYSRGIDVDDPTVARLVQKTDGVSAAFIKEVVRRSIQFCIARHGNERLETVDIDLALDEMLYGGGTLNRNLLGAGGSRWAENGRSHIDVHKEARRA
jgi:ATP-dependent 26S proteasome regulatory subunit